MNTNDSIITDRLTLLPGSNARDNIPFLQILEEDGDFRLFCGVEFSEANLKVFENYFERPENCLFSVFLKENPNIFIGYVGFHKEDRLEIEFYIAKPYRHKGYCEEACRAIIERLFNNQISIDNVILKDDKLYSTTLKDNICTTKLLEKIGFCEPIKSDGPVLIATLFVDQETDEVFSNFIVEHVLEKNR